MSGHIDDALSKPFAYSPQPIRAKGSTPKIWSLHRGRSRACLVRVVPDHDVLYRIEWPDIGLSATANLTRCMDAARGWAERQFLTEHRNLSDARRLKSLNFFWRSASYVRQNRTALVLGRIRPNERVLELTRHPDLGAAP